MTKELNKEYKEIVSKNNVHYSLLTQDNYLEDMNNNEIIKKYLILVVEYFKFIFSQNISLKIENLIKGFETITHVYLNILYYTKNIDVTYYHSEKAYYYFLEYVEQINNDENAYLQLTSKDAIIYVYKKTLSNICKKYKKENIEINEKFNNIKNIIFFFKEFIIENIILKKETSDLQKENLTEYENIDNNLSNEIKSNILNSSENIKKKFSKLFKNIDLNINKNYNIIINKDFTKNIDVNKKKYNKITKKSNINSNIITETELVVNSI
jgi:hypothetical protein